jgi:hypothetical protein
VDDGRNIPQRSRRNQHADAEKDQETQYFPHMSHSVQKDTRRPKRNTE